MWGWDIIRFMDDEAAVLALLAWLGSQPARIRISVVSGLALLEKTLNQRTALNKKGS